MNGHIFLTGMPGAGKSYWARCWALAHGYPYADLDRFIEAGEGKSISNIVDDKGEKYFRALERSGLINLLETLAFPTIIATGGGTVMDPDNLQLMREAGCIVYLRATEEELLAHLKRSPDSRPLIDKTNPEKAIALLLQERGAVYETADITINVAGTSEATFAEILLKCTNFLSSSELFSQERE